MNQVSNSGLDQNTMPIEENQEGIVQEQQVPKKKFFSKNKLIILLVLVIVFLSMLLLGAIVQQRKQMIEEFDHFDFEVDKAGEITMEDIDAVAEKKAVIPQTDPNYDLYLDVEGVFHSVFRGHDYEISYNSPERDAIVLWVADDGLIISSNDSSGISLTISVKDSEESSSESADLELLGVNLREKVAIELDKAMTQREFQKDLTNSSKEFNVYKQAYKKDNLRCFFATSGEDDAMHVSYDYQDEVYSISYGFTCFDNFEKNYNQQKPFLEDLTTLQENSFIDITNNDDEFALINVRGTTWFSGHYVLAQKIDGKWTELISGQDVPECKQLREYQVPTDVWDWECWVSDGDESKSIKYEL